MKYIFSRLGPGAKQALNLVGVSGIFWFAWAFGCYQTVYLQDVGFTASGLGLLNAISSGVAIASVSFWGMVSDKIGSLRKVLIVVLSGGALFYALVPLIPTGLPFSPLLFLCLLPAINFFRGSMATFTENLLVRNCNELRLNFGMLRSTGSFLFTVGSIIISSLLPVVGVENTFWLCGVLMLPPIIFTFFSRDPNAKPKAQKGESRNLNLGELFHNRSYVVFLVFIFLFYIAATCESSFIPYFMQDVGISSEKYGIILAYRALLEIPFLLLMVRLRRRFPLRNLVIAAAVLMAMECLGLSLITNSLPVMILVSTFFGLGNGLFIGSSLNYVYELAPDHLKASAQAFYASVSSVAGILGNLAGGVVFDAIGAKPFYLAVTGMYLVSVFLFSLSILREKRAAVSQKTA